MDKIVDLRSDTVTRPSPGMKKAMLEAELGDDVFGDDPTVNRLQARAAEIFGFEAGLLFPSGTQSNLAALMSHCQRGEEVILGMEAHSYRYEAGGAAVLGSIQPQTLANRPDGTLDLAEVEAAIKPDDPHFARTRLLALENTISGRVLGKEYLRDAVQLARKRNLATHLDGARICNAAAALKTNVKDLCAGFDSVSACLSKGLGAPAGTVLLGNSSLIQKAKRARKILGGAMRQAGVIAAAGLYALEHNMDRLAVDHENASRLAGGLRELGLQVEQHTNMVFVNVDRPQELAGHLHQADILVLPGARMRLVTHLDVDAAGIERALSAFQAFYRASAPAGRQARSQ
ncbi:MAG: low-specificity L-threonine aldolase [Burkholderiales bacterium]|jgi:threonine aldolase|nr:low-specificity L-threonine aldolase [Burkholderiales bacterium]